MLCKEEPVGEPCYFISGGELRAIVGDDTDHGAGQPQHSGVWFLTSAKEGHTAVSRGASVLVFGHHRGKRPSIRRIDERTVELYKDALPENNFVETHGIYRLTAPHYIDYEMTATARQGHKPQEQNSFGWCCYVNSPQERGIHFIERGIWTYYFNPVHGQGAMVFPTDLEMEARDPWGREAATTFLNGKRNFSHSDSGHTFDYPFYFGMIRGMMFQIMADDYQGFRFYLSPSGAGGSIIPGEQSPAWDFAWRADRLEVDEAQTLNVRVAYRRLEKTEEAPNGYAADHAWAEFRKFREMHPVRGLDT